MSVASHPAAEHPPLFCYFWKTGVSEGIQAAFRFCCLQFWDLGSKVSQAASGCNIALPWSDSQRCSALVAARKGTLCKESIAWLMPPMSLSNILSCQA